MTQTSTLATQKRKVRILMLDDDRDLQDLLTSYYAPRGYDLECHSDPIEPLRKLEAAMGAPEPLYDLVLSDLKMPKMDGLEFIQRMKRVSPSTPIILMTAHKGVEIAIQAIEQGAYDFVVKPIHFPQLNVSIERALHLRKLEAENHVLRTVVKSRWSEDGIVGKSPAIRRILDLARRVASSTANVLITGESGTGKEVIARAIHNQGARRDKPFMAINCAAIPEQLLESELFGYAKGAFTGAAEKRIGLFEEAEGGTIFLDEIGDMNLMLQAKLLRVLQERKIKRIGENQLRPINVRVVAATHKNLEHEVREKRFREDLFFRLNVIPISIPPLRERPEDILPLAQAFFERFRAQNESKLSGFTKAALEHLFRLPWRGNVRELENAVERAVVLAEGDRIDVSDLPAAAPGPVAPGAQPGFASLPAAGIAVASPVDSASMAPRDSAAPAGSDGVETDAPSPMVLDAAAERRVAEAVEAHLATPQDAPLARHAAGSVTARPTLPSAPMNEEEVRRARLHALLGEGPLPTLAELTLTYIEHVLEVTDGVREQAAKLLDIDRKTLYRRVLELDARKQAPASGVDSSNGAGDSADTHLQ